MVAPGGGSHPARYVELSSDPNARRHLFLHGESARTAASVPPPVLSAQEVPLLPEIASSHGKKTATPGLCSDPPRILGDNADAFRDYADPKHGSDGALGGGVGTDKRQRKPEKRQRCYLSGQARPDWVFDRATNVPASTQNASRLVQSAARSRLFAARSARLVMKFWPKDFWFDAFCAKVGAERPAAAAIRAKIIANRHRGSTKSRT